MAGPDDTRFVSPAQLGGSAILRHLDPKLGHVVGVFHDVVGPRLARHATATLLRDGTLTVRCTSAAWAQTVTMMDQDLVRRLNEALGAELVTRIYARAGAPSAAPQAEVEAPEPNPIVPLDPARERELEQLVAQIPDPALRARVLAAARATLERPKPAS